MSRIKLIFKLLLLEVLSFIRFEISRFIFQFCINKRMPDDNEMWEQMVRFNMLFIVIATIYYFLE